ncbi:hypothetical protein IWQ62_003703 [Dispira parvispora]|uniref:Glutamine amidotransferase type-2 domain-containing protein n=1 Tax=Dispira parvispora TaxID=1520584 RepID=A0A9W8E623_9FUNG|nr:hypothetical protein IWQ62_003703 [Dispira parvispora]
MCGIQLLLGPSVEGESDTFVNTVWSRLKTGNQRRGPTLQQETQFPIAPIDEHVDKVSWHLRSYATVLHLRGIRPTGQPLVDSRGRAWWWNGEVFRNVPVPLEENDGQILFTELCDALNNYQTTSVANPDQTHPCLKLLGRVEGPFAFVLWDPVRGQLWFARDCLGRRSLLWHRPTANFPVLLLTSRAFRPNTINDSISATADLAWEEVPAAGFYCLNVHEWQKNPSPGGFQDALWHYPWPTNSSSAEMANVGLTNSHIHSHKLPLPYSRVNQQLPEGPNDLVSIDPEQAAVAPGDPRSSTVNTTLSNIRCPPGMVTCAENFLAHLRDAITDRLKSIPQTNANTATAFRVPSTNHDIPEISEVPRERYLVHSDRPSRVAILFSGGVDCLVIAALAHQVLPLEEPIDLINVAFENPRVTQAAQRNNGRKGSSSMRHNYDGPPFTWCSSDAKPYRFNASEYQRLFDVPDRVNGRQSLKALRQWAPQRDWRFVAVNVPYSQVLECRNHIMDVMYPSNTVMDLSIATALWFAASGKGYLEPRESDNSDPYSTDEISLLPYISSAKVLLLGMGADEQLGGYSRHRDEYNDKGWTGLANEIQRQLDRISWRNLGRDDRILSDHGKEGRFPFLARHVIDYLSSVPVYWKVDPTYPRGIGEKVILRYALYQCLGFPLSVCQQWKKAIQFGARTAKMDTSKIQGDALVG